MIFQTTEIDNQIAQLKAERDRQTKLNEAATQYLSGLADLLDKLDKDAIAILKAELLALFRDVEPETLIDTLDEEGESIEQQDFEATADTPDEEPQPEETISDRVAQAKINYYQLIPTKNPALAYFKRHDGQLGSVYIGGMSQSRLQAWADWLYSNEYTIHPPVLREAKRLSNWRYEVKLPAMFITYLDDLIEMDYTRYPTPHSPLSDVLAA